MSEMADKLSEISLTVNFQNNRLLRINDQLIKSWVRTCLPFEYGPGWKAFLTMLSGEISLIKRFVLG
jgi:hypothetical protein